MIDNPKDFPKKIRIKSYSDGSFIAERYGKTIGSIANESLNTFISRVKKEFKSEIEKTLFYIRNSNGFSVPITDNFMSYYDRVSGKTGYIELISKNQWRIVQPYHKVDYYNVYQISDKFTLSDINIGKISNLS